LDAFSHAVSGVVGGAIHVCPAGPSQISQIGVITGGAGSEVQKIAKLGIDTFVTGEGPHWSYTLAEELGINVIYAGHYATETFGVRALAEALSQAFGVPHSFLDRPTGL
jgi:putative NIF3 family GTP cyclohydrolase 1 type 2